MSNDSPTPTVILEASAPERATEAFRRAAAILRAGGLVAFPTETVYGLGANALDPRAVARIFAAKGRPGHNPVIVHVADLAAVRLIVSDWPEMAEQLAARFWPGPLTLVLPRAPVVPDAVTGGGPTVGVRIPAHPVARRLLEEAGLPVAAPSANRSNQLSPTRAEHVLGDLGGCIDLILDAGRTPGGIESTVLDLSGVRPRLLRPGLVTVREIEALIGPIERSGERGAGVVTGEALPSPGMLARHYAPRTPLECVPGDDLRRVVELASQGLRVGWLTHEPALPLGLATVREERLPADPADYATELYDVLHRLDEAGLDRIVVAWPPEGEDWLGVRDRLRRAASP